MSLLDLPDDGSLSHNWLYSYLPIGKENKPALLGFCKNCRHQFVYYIPYTEFIHNAERYFEYDAQIPKYGCHPVD